MQISINNELYWGECCKNSFLVLKLDNLELSIDEILNSVPHNFEFDSILVIQNESESAMRMRIIEKDGTESDACGNGALLPLLKAIISLLQFKT